MLDRFLIIGLGNPGKVHQNNRHNVGHLVIDQLEGSNFGEATVYLAKTSVLMNSSGEQVKRLIDRSGVSVDNLVVIHDDLDIPLGEFRLQKGKGSAGHKGVESIIEALGSRGFWRLRVGIGRPPQEADPGDFVLQDFGDEEKEILRAAKPWIKRRLMALVIEIEQKQI